MTASIEPYELFAVKFAQHGGFTRHEKAVAAAIFAGDDPHLDDPNIYYYIWVAKRSDSVFIVDTGFETEAATNRGRRLDARPVEHLARLGIAADDVTQVILTHLHYDHAGGTAAFPKAQFHLQESEAAYATGRCMCHDYLRYPFDVEDIVSFVRLNFSGRIAFHDGSTMLSDGLSLHGMSGHTAGIQAVRVFTRRGWVCLASDASHFFANYRNNLVFPLVYDVAGLLDGYQKIRALADSDDHVIPGHDPLVMALYPPPSPDLSGIAVRLDVSPRS